MAQTMERHKRELEADEAEYEERLAAARKKEATMKKMAKARVHKKPVRQMSTIGYTILHIQGNYRS